MADPKWGRMRELPRLDHTGAFQQHPRGRNGCLLYVQALMFLDFQMLVAKLVGYKVIMNLYCWLNVAVTCFEFTCCMHQCI